MAASKRKILLIVDNCTAHPAIGNLKAIKLEFLPPNVTAILQPLDQGVIHCFKSNYRKMIVKRMIAAMEHKKTYDIDILGAMHLAKSAWNDVPQNTIAHCFRHAGFKTKEEFQKELGSESAEFRPLQEPLSPVDDTPDTNKMTQLLSVKFPDHDEFVAIDKTLQCCEENLNEDDFIARITRNEEICDSNDGEEIVQAFEKVNEKEAFNTINVLHQYFEGQFNSENFLQNLTDMESVIMKNSQMNFKQASFKDFFSKIQ